MDNKEGRDGGMNWEIVIDIYMCVIYSVYILYIYIYTIDTMNKIDNRSKPTLQCGELCTIICSNLNEKEIQKEGMYIYI